MDVTLYQAKVYPSPPCWNLVADVYVTELGQQVDEYQTISSSVRSIASAFRLVLHKAAHGFAQIDAPVDFAVVLMGKAETLGMHHAGIYYQGKVLHAMDTGSLYQDIESLRDDYPLMEFWAK